DYKFSSKAAKSGIKAELLNKKFPYENGSFIGAKEFMNGLLENDDYKAAFVTESNDTDPNPEPPAPKPQFSDPNPMQPQPKPKVSLADLMKRKNENPNAQINFD
ncbi:MAG: hypothetical protein ACLUFN_11330, partial [Eubacterium sp.]